MINQVQIVRRFQRSVRIDTDLGDAKALDGFICPQSYANALQTMAEHLSKSGQGAFTWTGPYGSGKSSLAVAFSVALGGGTDQRRQAAKIFGHKLSDQIRKAMPTGTKGWRIIPVVGRLENPIDVIGESMKETGLVERRPRGGWSERHLISTLQELAAQRPRTHGGIVLFIDEMGKFLESAVQKNTDIYVFQQLAEVASRSNGRIILIGILHQAFEEYASRISHEMRGEWAKIAGRFVDLSVSTTGEEQIDTISRAIENDRQRKSPGELARTTAALAQHQRSKNVKEFALTLESCWPLHPVTACLLGPISRRRFGQNQRSIFSFLNSSEPHGFQDFLQSAKKGDVYEPDRLWDYLRANLEPSILASSDGHRWALAADALERCETSGGDALCIRLLKTIAIVDLCKDRSGLVASFELLQTCFPDVSDGALKKSLNQLGKWSHIIFKKFLDAYTIFAGSDFDIDQAINGALEDMGQIDFTTLKMLAELQPILAKRHYHETGTMRWFDVNFAHVADIEEIVSKYHPENGVVGQFLLAVPTESESKERIEQQCRKAARHSDEWDIVVGTSEHSRSIFTFARELVALDNIHNDHPQLAGDAVARREVTERIATLQTRIGLELRAAMDGSLWFQKNHSPKRYRHADLNILASELADSRFDKCPRLHNELLNRQRPSSSATGAQKILLRRMVANEGEPRLGIEGFPAEGGLFSSMLEATKLYKQVEGIWRIVAPKNDEDHSRLAPLWQETVNYIKKHAKRTVPIKEIYDELWQKQPFGIKSGLIPILAVSFILTQRNKIAIYRDGIFRAHFDDVDIDYLSKDPSFIQLRWMNLSSVSGRILSEMSEVVSTLDKGNKSAHIEPIDIARDLVAIYEELSQWTKRTMQLSKNAIKIRDLFKRARDPNKFLFDDIPSVIGKDRDLSNDKDMRKFVEDFHEGLKELIGAYPFMLHRIRDTMLTELGVPNLSPQSLTELRERAENVKELTGDFRLEAFIGRLSKFDGTDSAFEAIASLVTDKPPRNWVDPDVDRAGINVAEMAQQFLRAEAFARIKGRPDKRQAMAVVVGMDGRPVPLLEVFDVADSDQKAIDSLVDVVSTAIENVNTKQRNIILASLAKISARYMEDGSKEKSVKRRKKSGAR